MKKFAALALASLAWACQDKAQPKESANPASDGSVSVDPGKTGSENVTKHAGDGVVTPSAATIPSGCSGNSTETANDLVLYRGEALAAPANNVITLGEGWKADEVWDNGRLLVEPLAAGSFISFSNEGIYHGFKLTPPSVNGVRRSFTLSGAEVYVELKRPNPTAALPTFGLRVIKPNEFEGNGGAPTTTWMLDKSANGSRFLTATTDCTLIPMVIPQTFLDQKAVGNRLIWEMQSNWNAADKILIRKIVLKGFQFAP